MSTIKLKNIEYEIDNFAKRDILNRKFTSKRVEVEQWEQR